MKLGKALATGVAEEQAPVEEPVLELPEEIEDVPAAEEVPAAR